MSIGKEIQRLTVEINSLDKLHKDLELVLSYDQRREELNNERTALTSAIVKIITLREAGRISRESLPDPSSLTELLGAVAERLERDPTTLTEGRDFLNLLEGIKSLSERLNELAGQTWTKIRSEEPAIDEQFLSQIENIPGQKGAVEELRREIHELRRWGETAPENGEEWDRYSGCLSRVRKSHEAVAIDLFPKDVRRFFKFAQGNVGAPMEMLTQEVKEWLSDNGLLDRIRIKIGPSL